MGATLNSSLHLSWINESFANPVIAICEFDNDIVKMLYAGTGDGHVVKFDQDGDGQTPLWTRDTGQRIECMLVQKDGSMLFAGCSRGIYALDVNTGVDKWFRETLGPILTLAQIGNILYCGGRDGWIYPIEL